MSKAVIMKLQEGQIPISRRDPDDGLDISEEAFTNPKYVIIKQED